MIETPHHPNTGPTPTSASPAGAPAASVEQALGKVTSATIRTGLYTGALLVLVTIISLIVANRLPFLENRALERNGACYTLFVLFTLIPVIRFWNGPTKMFASGMLAWSIFVIGYDISGMFFTNLFRVLRTPFEAFFEGAVVYGVCAVVAWVGGMALLARLGPIAPRRRRSDIFRDEE
ncbi:MAG TPA: hypothetical protein VGD60_17415 [Candidatus Acidoferrales bacterium]